MLGLVDYSSGEEDNVPDNDDQEEQVEVKNDVTEVAPPPMMIFGSVDEQDKPKKKKKKKRKKRKKKKKKGSNASTTKSVVKKLGINISDLMKGKSISTDVLLGVEKSKNVENEKKDEDFEDLEETLKVLPSKRKRFVFENQDDEEDEDEDEDVIISVEEPPHKKRKIDHVFIPPEVTSAPAIPDSILRKAKASTIGMDESLKKSIQEYLSLGEEERKKYDNHYQKERKKDFDIFQQKVNEYLLQQKQVQHQQQQQQPSPKILLQPYPSSQEEEEEELNQPLNNNIDMNNLPSNIQVVDMTSNRKEIVERLRKKEKMERFRREIYDPKRFKVLNQGSKVGGLKNQLITMAKDAARKELEYNDIRNQGTKSKSQSWGAYGW